MVKKRHWKIHLNGWFRGPNRHKNNSVFQLRDIERHILSACAFILWIRVAFCELPLANSINWRLKSVGKADGLAFVPLATHNYVESHSFLSSLATSKWKDFLLLLAHWNVLLLAYYHTQLYLNITLQKLLTAIGLLCLSKRALCESLLANSISSKGQSISMLNCTGHFLERNIIPSFIVSNTMKGLAVRILSHTTIPQHHASRAAIGLLYLLTESPSLVTFGKLDQLALEAGVREGWSTLNCHGHFLKEIQLLPAHRF